MGGQHLVRRLDFQGGISWVARLQKEKATPESLERLRCEAATLQFIREQSSIPVPEVYAYEATHDNAVGVAFIIMEFIPADTAMDSFGGWIAHRGHIPAVFQRIFIHSMAEVQVTLAALRFPKIGSIIKLSDGTYSIGPIPRIRGPFALASDFFLAWARHARFPLQEQLIRERTPEIYINDVLSSIRNFPSRLMDFSRVHRFKDGPFPIIHPNLYKSNVLVDTNFSMISVIDWDGAFIGPWEMVKFVKDLCIVPPIIDGLLYQEEESDRKLAVSRKEYIEVLQKLEEERKLDFELSKSLSDQISQSLAHSLWLYLDGRIGFYSNIFTLFK